MENQCFLSKKCVIMFCCAVTGDTYKPAQNKQSFISRISKHALLSMVQLANRKGERDNRGQLALIITQLFPGRYGMGDRSAPYGVLC